MTSKHQAFLDKYYTENNRLQQLTMLKDYMLSLPVIELTEFVQEPIRFFAKALEENKLTASQKKHLFKELDEVAALLEMKSSRLRMNA